MKLPYTEVKFYPEVKSQTGLSLFLVSCKRALKKSILIRQQFFDHLVIIHYLQQLVYSNHGLFYLRKWLDGLPRI